MMESKNDMHLRQTLDALIDHVSNDPVIADLLTWAKGEDAPFNLVGLSDTLKSLLLALLQRVDGQPLFLVVPDELTARHTMMLSQALFDGDRVLWLRGRPLTFIDAKAQSLDGERSRLAALHGILRGDFDLIIASPQTLLAKLPTPTSFRENSLNFKVGLPYALDAILLQLTTLGYQSSNQVVEAGQYARRGDIIDIGLARPFDAGCEGIRLSFFDDELDDIRRFDVETQRAIETVVEREITVYPARELCLPETAAARRTLIETIVAAGQKAASDALKNGLDLAIAEDRRHLAEDDANAFAEGILPYAADRWLMFFPTMTASAFDYAKAASARLVVDEMARTQQKIAAAQADQLQQFTAMLEQGHVLLDAEATTWTAAMLLQTIGNTDGALSLAELPGSGLAGGTTATIRALPQERYLGREENLIAAIIGQRQKGMAVYLCAASASRRERLTALLSDHGIKSKDIHVVEAPLQNGLVWEQGGLAIYGEADIFGTAKPKVRRTSKGLTIDLLSDLAPGDLVVHEDHGVGRYEGLTRLITSSGARDYLKIRYADAELHIAMERLEQIQKYVASGEKPPKLSKMGGVEWQNKKAKARASIKKLAFNLVELYAKRRATAGHASGPDTVWQTEFEERFPYEETPAQNRVIAEVKLDMESPQVMDRLVCGDVGFGKTEICFRAMFKCVMDGKQAALLSPTTVLTEQHYRSLSERLEGFPVNFRQLSRFVPKHERNVAIKGIKDGSVDMVVGTHRMLSNDVVFHDLGLLIIDEEQRFGVEHKEKLKSLYPNVDVLSLTATPIPRTLHMSLSGIRDISILDEGPDNRRPIQTYVLTYDEALLNEAMLREIGRDGQVFYLYNNTYKIEGKVAKLQEQLPGARIAIAHGKMSETMLERVIADFIAGEYDILCCTTIIESGIDMPNVNTLIVEDADRLGLAQLYQIRGRVGRSDRQAYAYITYDGDKALSEVAQKRLAAIRDFTELGSGFKIALKDLEVRGAGNLIGGEQSGHLEAIGYDLYTKMLDREVRALQGRPEEAAKPQAVVEIDVDAFLGDRYVDDPGIRIDMYRKIAAIASYQDRLAVEDELVDRFGDLPAETANLLDIAYVRSFAERHGIKRVVEQGSDVVLWFDENVQPDLTIIGTWMEDKAYKGRILFNAGHRPHLLIRKAAIDKRATATALRQLFALAEAK